MKTFFLENYRKELIELDKTKEALKCFDKAIELFPEVIQCYKLSCGLGNISVQTDTDKIKSSIIFFDKIIKLVPNFEIAYNSIGLAYFFSVCYKSDYHYLGKNYEDIRIFYNKIINYFDIAIKLNPKDIIAQLNKADALMFKANDLNYQYEYDKYVEGESDFQEYLMEHKDKKWSPWDLDSDTMDCKRTDKNGNEEYGDYMDWENEQHYESEEEITEKEELEEKEAKGIFIRDEKIRNEVAFLKEQSFFIYSFVINTYEQNIWYAYYRRAQKYFSIKSYRNCISDYNISIKFNPNYSKLYFGKAKALQKLEIMYCDGRNRCLVDAIYFYKKFIKIESNIEEKVTAYLEIASVLMTLENYRESIKFYDKALKYLKINNNDNRNREDEKKNRMETAYMGKGIALEELSENKEAIENYRSLIRESNLLDAYLRLGRLLSFEDIKATLNICEEAIEKCDHCLDMSKIDIYMLKGELLEEIGRSDDAIKIYDDDFNELWSYIRKLSILMMQKKYKEAIVLLNKIKLLDPYKNFTVHGNLTPEEIKIEDIPF